ncbi:MULTISPECIES: LysR family transcriptional regulator [Burkholderia]|uniref:LysR family transcriptional regulator n=1 Tax=Burkholderia TaxID=32008 RepID=UPI000A79CE6D|nr:MULTISPECIES: LysR family transcriptional regulator [Burkholderia]
MSAKTRRINMRQFTALQTHGLSIVNVLADMEMFVRVVECGSFAAAAEASQVSAQMVAKRVQAIEARLGARLLHRTTRRQQLSDVGQLYYERCKRALAEVERPNTARPNCTRRRAACCASSRRWVSEATASCPRSPNTWRNILRFAST